MLELVGAGRFEINLSVPLVLEYEDVLRRTQFGFNATDIRDVLDYLCAVGNHQFVYFLWRPFLPDPKDDMILELAVTAGCSDIVTFNARDFSGADSFGVRVQRPIEFLRTIGELR